MEKSFTTKTTFETQVVFSDLAPAEHMVTRDFGASSVAVTLRGNGVDEPGVVLNGHGHHLSINGTFKKDLWQLPYVDPYDAPAWLQAFVDEASAGFESYVAENSKALVPELV